MPAVMISSLPAFCIVFLAVQIVDNPDKLFRSIAIRPYSKRLLSSHFLARGGLVVKSQ